MKGYIRCREVSADMFPYPKDQGFMAVEMLNKAGERKGQSILYRECFVPAQTVLDETIKYLKAKGWRPPDEPERDG